MKSAFFYLHTNGFGIWTIAPVGDHWEIAHADELLGRYNDLYDAHKNLVLGRSISTYIGLAPDQCDLPGDLADWEQICIHHG